MRKIILALAILFLNSALVFSTAQADTIRVPEDYPTIQEGIGAAVDGDMVLVAPGTYYENINFLGKAITVKSEAGPEVTTIDGSQLGSVVTFENREGLDSVIDGFTITNGSGTYTSIDGYAGGGVFCYFIIQSTSPTIINNIITGNSVDGCGAGIYGNEFKGVIRDNIISDNSATSSGAGIYLRDVRVTTTIEGNTITQNTATGHGGGISIGTYGTPNILDNTITLNTAGGYGGGIFVNEYTNSSSYATIEDNIIHKNSANSGGGIHYGVDATISNNTITENTATSRGGGIYAQKAGGIISNNIITKNFALNPDYNSGSGGGITCYENSNPTITNNTIAENFAFSLGGGISCRQYSSPVIEGNFISKNSTDLDYNSTDGGGIACSDRCNATIKNNIIAENSSVYGGGIWSFASSLQILNNLIYKNSAVKRGGGAVLRGSGLSPNNTFILINNTFTNNTADDRGGGIYSMYDCDVTQSNDILWNNDAPLGPEIALGWGSDEITFTTSYSDIEGGESEVYISPSSPNVTLNWGSGMIDDDPLFINPEAGHFSLDISSPCIDAGDPEILDPDETISNMGTYGGPDADTVNLTFVSGETQVQPGGVLEYTILLSNNFADNAFVYGMSEVILPNGRPYAGNPVFGPAPVNLSPYQTIQPQMYRDIPYYALPGDYIYVGKVGTEEAGVMSETSFDFEITE